MIDIIQWTLFVLLIFKLLMTMYQKKFNETGGYKRIISLYQSLYLGVLYIVVSGIMARGLSFYFVYIAIVAAIILGFLIREKLFPYSFKCEKCNKKLKLRQILFIDTNKCPDCQNFD